MTYFHVRISVEGERHDEVKVDLDQDTLERQVLSPYRSGDPITVNGRTLEIDAVSRIRVSRSDETSAVIIERLKAQDRASSVAVLGGPSYTSRAAAAAHDVTDEFIVGPPGVAASDRAGPGLSLDGTTQDPTRGDKVFVVAGRDGRAVGAVTTFLRAIGLRVIEWEHAVVRTGEASPYVGHVVATGLQMADAALIIITPDDVVQLRDDLVRDDDGPEEREPALQARPNVYYEAGIADTIDRRKTVIVEVGKVKPFTDAAGRHVVRYDGSPAKRNALAERLRIAGLEVDTSGGDWLTAGDISPAVEAAREAGSRIEARPRSQVDKGSVAERIDVLLAGVESMRSRSRYDDLSDLAQESLDWVLQAQSLLDQAAPDSSFAREATSRRDDQPHIRLPVLVAALRGVRLELPS